jgi:hypothetical protein
MNELVASALIVGLASAGLCFVVRALVPVNVLILKPFSCDLCMSWWGSIVGILLLTGEWTWTSLRAAAVAVLAGTAVALLVVKIVIRLRIETTGVNVPIDGS